MKSGKGNQLVSAINYLVEQSGKELISKQDDLFKSISPYWSNKNVPTIYLVSKLLLKISDGNSDFIIKWLLEEPNLRLASGNEYIEPKWVLAGKLIEKFSKKCSKSLFKKLEDIIYYFPPTTNIDGIRNCLESRRKGFYYDYWGMPQYFLLPKLDKNRVSRKSKELIAVLKRKFKKYSEEDFCCRSKLRSGLVTSPLPPPNNLSDNAWKKIILAPDNRANSNKWRQINGNTIAESSIRQFSRSLGAATRNQPIRFAKLALTLPARIIKLYIQDIYHGLMETGAYKVDDKYNKNWKICPPDVTEKVISHFKCQDCEYELTWLLEDRINERGWSKDAIKMLIDLAKNAKEPKLNQLNISCDKLAEDVDSNILYQNAINCARSKAYIGLSKLFWNGSSEPNNALTYW